MLYADDFGLIFRQFYYIKDFKNRYPIYDLFSNISAF